MTDCVCPLTLPLTPAFRPVLHRCDGHKPFQRLTLDTDVRALVFPLLAASNLGNVEPRKLLNKEAAARLSRYLTEYADTKGVYMKINYVNADHVHALVDLPTNLSIEELIQLLKGNSSHWVNANNIVEGKFCVGKRLRRLFGVGIQCRTGSCRLHCRARGASSGTDLRRRASGIHRAPWIALAG